MLTGWLLENIRLLTKVEIIPGGRHEKTLDYGHRIFHCGICH